MKLIKSLLLGTAASLAVVAGAQAADLPSKKAAPAQYVKICTAYGDGYFYIPGTDTCIRLNGVVLGFWQGTNVKDTYTAKSNPLASGKGVVFSPSADAKGNLTATGKQNSDGGFYSRGRLGVDLRSETAYGTLRGFFRLQINNNDTNTAGTNGTSPVLDKGFVQWAGLTAGRAQSFFDFYADSFSWQDAGGSDTTVNTFAYTATFGNGFQATVALEDARIRQDGTAVLDVSGSGVAQGGTRFPNVVGALQVNQGWGSAQLSGAYSSIPVYKPTVGNSIDSQNGWAVQAGVQFKLPMLGAGDSVYLQAAYAYDALSYAGLGGNGNGTNYQAIGQYGFVVPVSDVITDGSNVSNSKAWNVTGAFQHFFLPNLSAALIASYNKINYNNNLSYSFIKDVSLFIVGPHIAYQPVKNLDLSVEAFYARTTFGTPANGVSSSSSLGVKKDQNDYTYRIAVERDF